MRLVCLITGTDAGREQPRRMLILVSVSNHDNSDDLNDDIDFDDDHDVDNDLDGNDDTDDDLVQLVSVTTGAGSAGSMRSCTWRMVGGESAWSVEVTELVPTVRCVRRTTSSLLLKMLMVASLACLVTVTQVVRSCKIFLSLISILSVSGSTNLQCSIDGKCRCKPGVTGDKCDQCDANYWNFPDEAGRGCESCECMVEGSAGNR